MKDLNIPIYRAKKIDSDEYVIGYYLKMGSTHYIYRNKMFEGVICVDKLTLAIHFPNMLDSDYNPIFASLSEDGKGGDICSFSDHKDLTAMWNSYSLDFDFGNVRDMKNYHMDCKVVGIQE